MNDYIAKVKAALDAASALSMAISREQAKHGDSCIIVDQGEVGAAREELRAALRAVREADQVMEVAA